MKNVHVKLNYHFISEIVIEAELNVFSSNFLSASCFMNLNIQITCGRADGSQTANSISLYYITDVM